MPAAAAAGGQPNGCRTIRGMHHSWPGFDTEYCTVLWLGVYKNG